MSLISAMQAESSLQSLWTLSETAGSAIVGDRKDSTPGTVGASVTLGAPSLAAELDTVASFPGGTTSAAWIDFGASAYDEATAGAFSVELMFTKDSITDGGFYGLIGKRDGSLGWGIWTENQRIGLEFNGVAPGDTFPDLAAGAPVHLIVTYNGAGSATTYTNGVSLNGHGSLTISSNTETLKIGALDTASFTGHKGKIGPVAIYNVALSQGQVTTHYLASLGDFPMLQTLSQGMR